MSTDSIAELRSAVSEATRALREGETGGPEPSLDRPPKPELGDYSSNAAMLLAAPLGENPRDVAGRLGAELERQLGGESGSVERIEVAGPGFVNLFLADAWYRRAMQRLAESGEDLGPAPTSSPERILVEFVSANPTGPLHVGGGRHAAYGDALVRLLRAVGHEASSEYYVNDGGGQIERFARSIAARMTGAEPPEDGYGGEYVAELAERVAADGIDAGDIDAVGRRGVELVLERRPRHARPLRGGVRHLVPRARPLRQGRGRAGARPPRAGGPLLPQRGGALAADHRLRRRQGPGADPRQRRADLPGRRRRLPLGQARARLRPPDRRARRRPPRLRAAPARGDRLPRRRPRRLRGGDHAPRPHRRRRRAGPDVEAQRRLRLARRAARRDRRRRGPLVHALAQPRHHRRPRPRARPPRVERQPRLLRPVRPREDRQHPAQGRGGGARAPPPRPAPRPRERLSSRRRRPW